MSESGIYMVNSTVYLKVFTICGTIYTNTKCILTSVTLEAPLSRQITFALTLLWNTVHQHHCNLCGKGTMHKATSSEISKPVSTQVYSQGNQTAPTPGQVQFNCQWICVLTLVRDCACGKRAQMCWFVDAFKARFVIMSQTLDVTQLKQLER